MARSGVDRNFRNLGARLRALEDKVTTETKEIVEYWTGEIEVAAFRDAPGGGDRIATEHGTIGYEDVSDKRRGQTPIAQAIGYVISPDGLTGTVYVDASAGDIAAYVEFGTGQSAATYLATVPESWRKVAEKYIINKKGTILEKSYLLSNILKYEPKFIEDLKKLMGDLRL
jgi:hypothetical protein